MSKFSDDPDVKVHMKALKLFADHKIFPDAQERLNKF